MSDSNKHSDKMIKLQKDLLYSGSDGDPIFTIAGEKPIFSVKHCIKSTFRTMSIGKFQTSKLVKVEDISLHYCNSKSD